MCVITANLLYSLNLGGFKLLKAETDRIIAHMYMLSMK